MKYVGYTVVSSTTVKSFTLFIDAWLYAMVVLKEPCQIVGIDGEWLIKPKEHNQ